jgi:hypothetical protein
VLDYLKWGHIKPIIRNERAIAARITVYAGENEQYYSYITPEALKALQEWMDYRAQEILTHCFWMAKVTMTHADHTGGG